MNGTIFAVAGALASSNLLLDFAVKGTALLVLAAVVAAVLRRDSAATRHLVWLLAIVAMLALPLLSALLPEWRVLPQWAGVAPELAVAEASPRPIVGPAHPVDTVGPLPRNADGVRPEPPRVAEQPPVAELPDARPAPVMPESAPDTPARNWTWIGVLPFVWTMGSVLLILRLVAARWLLRSAQRRATVIGSSGGPAGATADSLLAALETTIAQLRLRRPVTLLVHPQKTIPVVWGILRCYLMLPAAARQWGSEQLRSVLLHELAHVQRRDTAAQLLSQVACALHWFNPLVWFAAWRLGVEGERACDDLVLASGVRPSAYASHLLEIVADFSPARWMQSCGLAMARKSSLEGRLLAVISVNLNRRAVSLALAAIAVAVAVGVAVPIAMLRAGEEKPGDEANATTIDTTAKDGEASGEAVADKLQPKSSEAQKLLKHWRVCARTDGKIPGALIGKLGEKVKWEIAHNNGGADRTARYRKLLPRLDATHDWLPADAIALLDDVAAISTNPIGAAVFAADENMIRPGRPLPAELADAPWGKPSPDGLRVARLLEPRAKEYPLNTWLKSRVLVHNSGKKTAVFCMMSWLQGGGNAHDAKGAVIPVSSIKSLPFVTKKTYRLAPGEYCETPAAGVDVGLKAKHDNMDWDSRHVGAHIDTKVGEEVHFSPFEVPLLSGVKDGADLWQKIVAERVERELPLPATAAERTQIIRRVTLDLFGQSPTPQEIAAFVADKTPAAAANLEKRLANRPGVAPFTGTLSPGDIQFRVLPADPDAANRPMGGETLDPGVEKKLRWGEPVKGLRAAAVIRPAPGKPKPSNFDELYLAVQNVSDAPIRLCDTTASPHLRVQWLYIDNEAVSAHSSQEPIGIDVTLQPHEVAFLLMFVSDRKSQDGHTMGSILANDLVKERRLSMVGEMQIEKAPAGAWTGKLSTARTSGEIAANKPLPKSKEGLALYRQWQTCVRTDGGIPGALIDRLAAKVRYFIELNKKDSENGRNLSEKFEKLLPRFDATRDWTESDAVALIDDVAAIHRIPLNTALETAEANAIHGGEPLPADLENAPWGQPSPDGLRVAYLVEPRAKQYPLGTPLGARILVHNAGKKPVVFVMPSWQQSASHAAHDAKGAAIAVSSMHWLTQAQKRTYRLWPGMYCECLTPGIGVGAETTGDNWANVSVGSHIDAKPGDDVRFTPGPIQVNCSPSMIGTTIENGRPTNVAPKDAAELWEWIVTERVGRELPLPAAAAERDQTIRRVMVDLTGNLPTQEEIAAFVADRTPDAHAALVKRLLNKPGIVPFTGTLQPGDIQFRVLPAEQDAAKTPRIVTGPGYYNLGDHVRLSVERAPYGQRRTNKATIQFFSADRKAAPPGKPYEIPLPDGVGTYCITWVRGVTALWVIQKGMVRAYDFTNPAQVIETTFKEPAGIEKLPKPIADALPPIGDTPVAPPASVKP
jgi:beta-lactamase regulating signal transducer with metallopeptidase domain